MSDIYLNKEKLWFAKTECYSMATEVKKIKVSRKRVQNVTEKDYQEGLKRESFRQRETGKVKIDTEK